MTRGNGLGALLALAGVVFANILLAHGKGTQPLAAFVITVAAIVLLLAFVGRAIKDRPAGIIIDNRNRVSLSKLQMTAWTVLIIAGLITIAAMRMHAWAAAPLQIEIGPELLIVMGISASSLVATPALLSLKTTVPPEPDEIADALKVGDLESEGLVHGRPDAKQAAWADIFRGDEVSNAASPDLSKVQQFLITGLLLAYYAILLGRMCWLGENPAMPATTADKLGQLPNFDASMVWLLGISHAGYLGYKAAPHSRPGAPIPPVEEVG